MIITMFALSLSLLFSHFVNKVEELCCKDLNNLKLSNLYWNDIGIIIVVAGMCYVLYLMLTLALLLRP